MKGRFQLFNCELHNFQRIHSVHNVAAQKLDSVMPDDGVRFRQSFQLKYGHHHLFGSNWSAAIVPDGSCSILTTILWILLSTKLDRRYVGNWVRRYCVAGRVPESNSRNQYRWSQSLILN